MMYVTVKFFEKVLKILQGKKCKPKGLKEFASAHF